MVSSDSTPLGRKTGYPIAVDPAVLITVARADARTPLRIHAGALPFDGADIWNAWELSWLDSRGKPCVAVVELRVPCESPHLVESKSLKLYLNGYAMTRFEDALAVQSRIEQEVSGCVGADVSVDLLAPGDFGRLQVAEFAGESLDDQALEVAEYAPPNPEHLRVKPHSRMVEEALVSHAFRSRCPVTGQPDWASVQIRYRGAPLDRAGLLRYLVSFREHADFHEACVERMFVDIQERCAPLELLVYARFLRRGGIDINPWRATPGFAITPVNLRSTRQ